LVKKNAVSKKRIEELFKKYQGEPAEVIKTKIPDDEPYILSREYKIFKQEVKPRWVEFYEKACAKAGRILPLKLSEKDEKKLIKTIKLADLDVTPGGVASISFFALLGFVILALFSFIINPLLMILLAITGLVVYSYLKNLPTKLVEQRRIKASGEGILAILYLVIYMRHTPNLEAAVKFASDNLTGPLANSFRKLLWDVQSRKYKTMSEALDTYTEEWSDYNKPFVDAIYLIESSIYQTSNERRKELLNRALDRVLEGTFDNMSVYANSLKTPVDTLYTIGIILPVLGLVMFPLAAAFMSNIISANTLITLYNVVLPVLVLIFEKIIFTKRPVGFPTPNIKNHPLLPKPGRFFFMNKQVPAIIPAILIAVILSIPYVLYAMNPPSQPSEVDVLVSLLPVAGVAGGIYAYTKLLSSKRLELMNRIKEVEKSFSDALFQLGNRIAEGLPPEVAIKKVAEVLRKTEAATFFHVVINNMTRLGYSLERAIFDEEHGALRLYPSPLIKSIMEVFTSSAKKSLEVTAVSLINISRYLQNMDRVNKKIQDMLSDTVSGLKFQASVITPIICGVVVGLTSLILLILNLLSERMQELMALGGGELGTWTLGMFAVSNTIPLHLFQPIVGFYMIEVIILISFLDADIETSGHSVFRKAVISSLMLPAILLYIFISSALTIVFSGLGRMALAIGGAFA